MLGKRWVDHIGVTATNFTSIEQSTRVQLDSQSPYTQYYSEVSGNSGAESEDKESSMPTPTWGLNSTKKVANNSL